MNRFLLLILTLFVFESCKTSQISTNQTSKISDLKQYFQYSSTRKPIISVHRGGGDEVGFPENCIESFNHYFEETKQNAVPLIIECDIELTKDSVMMMMHDNSLDRTTIGSGKIISKNWSEIKKLTLKDNKGNLTKYTIPTLEEVIKWGKNKVIFTLDVKRNTPYKKVIQMVEKLHAENYCIIITYDVNQAKRVYELNKNLLISVTIRDEKEYQRHKEAGILDENMIAFIGTREPIKEFCDFLHQKGISTILGTLGNLDKMAASKGDDLYKKWANDGADVLSTDRPLEMNKIFKNSQ